MKKIVDKPSKTITYIVTLLLAMTIGLKGDAGIAKTLPNPTPASETAVETIVFNEPHEVHEDVIADKRQVALSRGGSVPIKVLTQKEIINKHVIEIATNYNLKPELIMSIIQQESEYNPKAKNGNCLGLMQVSSYWHKDRASRLGVTDFYDSYSNILLGVDYISELMTKYKDPRLVLMLYNMDHQTAMTLYKNGQISNYAKTILDRAEKYSKGE